MIAEVYDALRSAGADEEKARAAATAVAESDFRFAEIRTEIANFRAEFERRMAAHESRLRSTDGGISSGCGGGGARRPSRCRATPVMADDTLPPIRPGRWMVYTAIVMQILIAVAIFWKY